MDFALNAHQQAMIENVEQLCARFDLDYWRKRDAEGGFPHDFHAAVAKAGYLGVAMPVEHGGAGLGITEAALVMQAIAQSGAGLSGASAVHMNMFGLHPVVVFGTPEQQARWLPPVIRGEQLACFGVTEPNTGLNTLALTTRAIRDGDHYVVTGQKIWISTAQVAHKILLLARTTPIDERSESRGRGPAGSAGGEGASPLSIDERSESRGRGPAGSAGGEGASPLSIDARRKSTHGLSLFYADLDRSCVEAREIDKLGRACVDSNQLFIDGLRIPVADRIGEEGRGFEYILHGFNPERILIAAEAVGLGRAALRLAAKYANERIVFDRPIGKNQAIQHPLAQRWMELEAASLMAMKAAWLYDRGEPCGAEANAAKYLAGEAGYRACETAVMTHGGMGYAKEYHVERLLRESLIPRLVPVSRELIMSFIAEKVLALPKSY